MMLWSFPTNKLAVVLLFITCVYLTLYLFQSSSPPKCLCVQETSQRQRNEEETQTLQMKSILNMPEWYRTKDFGARPHPSLRKLKVLPKGDDQEELTLWDNFFFGTTKGVVIEVGAYDGLLSSISNFFEREAKWRSILIEGNPKISPQLPINRPLALSFHAALCGKARDVHYMEKGGNGGILEFMSQAYLQIIHPYFLTNGELDLNKVESDSRASVFQCLPLSDILKTLKIYHINFFSLDVEGAEMNVLRSIDFDLIKFDVISVECNLKVNDENVTRAGNAQVVDFLISKNYVVWARELGRNAWFVHPDFKPFRNPDLPPATQH